MNFATLKPSAPTLEGVREALADFGRAHPEILRMEVFGSVGRQTATEASDVDVAVEFEPAWVRSVLDTQWGGFEYFGHLGDLEEELSAFLGRPVHLVENGPDVSNARLTRAIARDGQRVYDAD